MKRQVVLIHGGDTFDSYEEYVSFLKSFELDFARLMRKGWKDGLAEALGDTYEVIAPMMPNKTNAKYLEWKIWFDKLLPFLRDRVILVGHSLGGIFLVKYLSENVLPKKILGTFLVAAPYDAADSDYSLADFALPVSLKMFDEQGGKIFIYHSEDDWVVPSVDLEKYKKALPNAQAKVFKDRGHFNQETFPELIRDIQSI